MTTKTEPVIVVAERIGAGVYIEFTDGSTTLFPASFLYAQRSWYQIDVPSDGWEHDPQLRSCQRA